MRTRTIQAPYAEPATSTQIRTRPCRDRAGILVSEAGLIYGLAVEIAWNEGLSRRERSEGRMGRGCSDIYKNFRTPRHLAEVDDFYVGIESWQSRVINEIIGPRFISNRR